MVGLQGYPAVAGTVCPLAGGRPSGGCFSPPRPFPNRGSAPGPAGAAPQTPFRGLRPRTPAGAPPLDPAPQSPEGLKSGPIRPRPAPQTPGQLENGAHTPRTCSSNARAAGKWRPYAPDLPLKRQGDWKAAPIRPVACPSNARAAGKWRPYAPDLLLKRQGDWKAAPIRPRPRSSKTQPERLGGDPHTAGPAPQTPSRWGPISPDAAPRTPGSLEAQYARDPAPQSSQRPGRGAYTRRTCSRTAER